MYQKLVALALLFFSLSGNAQTTPWALSAGSSTADVSRVCKTAPNGNVYMAGKFTGTMDLDPGAGVHNVTSNGNDDIFVACYSPSGNFLWGFNIGGADYDAALNMAVDTAGNLIICGYIQSTAIDFDPSTSAAYIGYSGGSGLPYNGDGFIAKYSGTGAYLWGQDIGGTTINDVSLAVATDISGNVYVSGIFEGAISIGGSGSLSWLSGQAYVIKYSSTGAFTWGHNFGAFGSDCFPRSLVVKGNSIYVGGSYAGTANFYPWGSGAYLTSTGVNDPFFAKYDTAGNFVFVKSLAGNGNDDVVNSLSVDSVKNIYIAGQTTSSSLVFDPAASGSSTASAPGGGGNYDFFIAGYDSSGNYRWGKVMGGSGDDVANSNDVAAGFLYCTGGFRGTVDFDPSSRVVNLTSAGGADIFLAKYNLNGGYVCGFKTGAASTDDIGYGLAHADTGFVFCTGQFGGSSVDFDPSPGTAARTSVGSTDAFLAKYIWKNDTTFTGYLEGDSICFGQNAYLTLHITSGITGPYAISLFNGTSTVSYSGIYSGVPFMVTPRPTDTTTYTLTSALPAGASMCSLPAPSVLGAATVIVRFRSTHITDTVVACNSVRLRGYTADTTYAWDFGDGDTSGRNPVVHTYTAAGTYIARVTVTDTFGCRATDTAMFTIYTPPLVDLGRDTSLCANSYRLQSSYTYPGYATYLWNTGATTSFINATASGSYRLTVTEGICSVSDTMNLVIRQQPIVSFGRDTTFCSGNTLVLTAFIPTGSTYTWSTGATGSTINVTTSGTYWLTVSNGSCTAHDSITVAVNPTPVVNLGPDISQCAGIPIMLKSNDTNRSVSYLWNTGSILSRIQVMSNGTFWLKETVNGCIGSDTVTVTIKPVPHVDLGNDAFLCIGASLMLSSTQPGGAQYLWSDGSTATTLNITVPGTYKLTVNLNGCIDSDQVVVYELKAPRVFLGQDTTLCYGFVLPLLASGDQATYTWSDGTTGKSFNVSQNGVYWVTVANQCGTATDTISVTYRFCDLWFPNAFSPNNDGHNDIIKALGQLGQFSEYSLHIFNRWGQLLYKTETITDGWDGLFKGVPQDIGTYFYLISFKSSLGQETLKGSFELIR